MAISGALAADTDGELSVTRDPTRIDPILDKIRDLWKRHPDMRLGQLIFLLVGGKDLWSIEDRDGAPAIDLIDGDQLCELLKSLKLGVRTELVERVVVDGEWFARV